MKRNFIFFVILVLLGTFSYFYEEVGKSSKIEEQKKKTQILSAENLGQLQGFSNARAEIVFDGNSAFTKIYKIPVNPNKMDFLYKALSSVYAERVLSKEEAAKLKDDNLFPNEEEKLEFVFENDHLVFTLGKKLKYDQSYYLKVKSNMGEKIVIAKDKSVHQGSYPKEEFHRNSEKFLKFRSLTYLDDDFFYQTKIFKEQFGIKGFELENFRNKKFYVDYEKRITKPASLHLVGYNHSEFKKYATYLGGLDAKTLYHPFDYKLLKEPIAQLNIFTTGKTKVELSLFKKYGSLEGFFLKTNLNQYLYELDPAMANLFFQNVQDFWNLIVPFSFEKAPFLVSFTGKEMELAVETKGEFKVSVLSRGSEYTPINEQFFHLATLFQKNASYITVYEDEEKVNEIFKISRNNRDFLLGNVGNDLFVIDLYKRIKYHYTHSPWKHDESINIETFFLDK